MKTDLSSLFMPRQSQMPKDEAVSIYDSYFASMSQTAADDGLYDIFLLLGGRGGGGGNMISFLFWG